MPRSPSTENRPTPLRRAAIGSFRQYEQAPAAEQHRADIRIITQLGTERTAMWSRWIAEVGSSLGETERTKRSATLGLPPPPEPPSSLVDDIAPLRSEIGRELLTGWAQLGRLALKEASGHN